MVFDKKRIIEAYNNHAAERDEKPIEGKSLAHVTEAIDILHKEKKRTILEIGSGPGKAALLLKNAGFEIDCIDNSEKMIQLVKRKGINAMLLDCCELKRISKKYDAIYSINCFLHVPKSDFEIILPQVPSVMENNGLFFLGLWGGDDSEGIWEEDNYYPKRFFMLYKQETLLSMLLKYFLVESYQYVRIKDDAFFHNVLLRKSAS